MSRLFKVVNTINAAFRRQRKRPKSRASRAADALLTMILMAYLIVLWFPQIVFARSVSYRHFQVYSVAPLDPNIRTVLDKTERRLDACEINEPQAVHRVFVCPSHAAFRFFSPFQPEAFAANLPFRHNIFINTADVAGDVVTNGAKQQNRRSLNSVIAHECTHTLLADRFGQIGILGRSSWKQEGYCDWVSGQTSFDPADGTRMLEEGRSDSSPSFFYFRSCTAVNYLKNREHWSISQIMDTSLTLDDVLAKALHSARSSDEGDRLAPNAL